MKPLLFIFMIFAVNPSHAAAMEDRIELGGKIVKFDKSWVTLKDGNGKSVKIIRSAFTESQLRSTKTIFVSLRLSDLAEINRRKKEESNHLDYFKRRTGRK